MRSLPSIRLGFLLALTGCLAIPLFGADQQSAVPPSRTAPGVQTTAPKKKKAGAAASPLATKIAAARKSKMASAPRPASESGKRDPFKVPTPPSGHGDAMNDSAPGEALPPGVRGLLIAQLRLEGVVREQESNKMIAVVTNDTKRAYFLSENEAVYNGVVSKITPDAVYFKENVLDANGRLTTHEVMKRLGPASGEGR
jgi:hypothetical protein